MKGYPHKAGHISREDAKARKKSRFLLASSRLRAFA